MRRRFFRWNFELPGLADRREDIELNLDYELTRYAEKSGKHITFNKEGRSCFLEYALDPGTLWQGNFRDLNAMVTRMATLASGGRIDPAAVRAEIERTRKSFCSGAEMSDSLLNELLGSGYADRYDLFELEQLKAVVNTCRKSKTLAEAGKKLFAVSRRAKQSSNDSDRLRKFLARFGLDFARIRMI